MPTTSRRDPFLAYLTTWSHRHPIQKYLEYWAQTLDHRIEVFYYEDLIDGSGVPSSRLWKRLVPREIRRRLRRPATKTTVDGDSSSQHDVRFCDSVFRRLRQAATVIFSDVERLSPAQAKTCAIVWDRLAGASGAPRLLNHPTRVLRRYELLRSLHQRGLNDFNAYRITDGCVPVQWPVFIRVENDHVGNWSDLLSSPQQLRRKLDDLDRMGESREDKIVVEFCDVSDDGDVFHKFSTFKIGERLIPKHLFFSRSWMIKASDIRGPEQVQQELEYCESNPHEQQLRDAFALAQVDYGRVDYGLRNGKIQIWEINTNPVILSVDRASEDFRPQLDLPFAERFATTMCELATSTISNQVSS